MGLDEVTEALYALPRDEFTPTRNERVKTAKADGDRELANAIGRLRRPTASAWLLNQLVRDDPGELAAVAELGEALRAAHARLDGAALQQLSARRRERVGEVLARTRELGREAGQPVSDAVARELEDMVTAALADADAARVLASGRLTSSKDLSDAATLSWPAVDPDARPRPAPPRQRPEPEAPAPEPRKPGAPAGPATTPEATKAPKATTATKAPKATTATKVPKAPKAPKAEPRAQADGAAVARARAELDARADALAEAEKRAADAGDTMDTAADEETAAHRAVADLRARLTEAEQHEQRARQDARAARRAHDDAERLLREARRRREVAAERLAALTGEGQQDH